MDIEKLKFPIGKYQSNKTPNSDLISKWIKEIAEFPLTVNRLTTDISIEQLNWKYRPNGWRVKQVIHHCADSHINALMRFKLTLTEQTPTIRPYFEGKWAALDDSLDNNIEDSMNLLNGLHRKWGILLKSLTATQLKLEFIHPEHGKKINLAENIGIYSWHCKHHLAHIKNGIESNGKYN